MNLMLLEKPAFSPKLSAAEAERGVSSLLSKNHWKEFSFKERTLFFIPYWFFSFDIYSGDAKRTTLLDSGFGSLNAFSNELDDSIAELIKEEGSERIQEIDDKSMEDGATRVVSPRVSEEEAREIISLRLASGEETSKDSVIVSGLQMLFVPIWLISAKVGGKEISLRVNAASGGIENKYAVPRREKGFAELTSELLEELRTPEGWLEYSASTVEMVSEAISGAVEGAGRSHGTGAPKPGTHHAHGKEGLSREDIAVIILSAVAVLVILWAVYRF